MKSQHIPEEKLIDFLENKLNVFEMAELEKHIETCEKCQKLLLFWQDTLEIENVPLTDKIKGSSKRRSPFRYKRKSKQKIFGLVSIAVIFLLVYSLADFSNQHLIQTNDYEVYQNKDIMSDQVFLNNPVVDKQPIQPYKDFAEIEGMVWINPQTQEILLQVEGLTGLYNNDYQVWIVDKNGNANGDLMIAENGVAKMLYRLDDLSHYRFIKGSLEPAGGSHQPTGPGTFYVDVEK